MDKKYREGTLVKVHTRLSQQQIELLHQASLSLLDDPGILSFNEHAANLFNDAGCNVTSEQGTVNAWRVRFPENLIMDAVGSAPQAIVLGARNPHNKIMLNADVPSVYFGTGSEANIYLNTEMSDFVKKEDPSFVLSRPAHKPERGSIRYLCQSAKLCNQLKNVDFFVRNVNIQDEEITLENKDVNVFLASLMYMTKHVQAGLVHLNQLDNVLKMAEIIAGGPDKLQANPIISFITSVMKSPLQMVEDTTEKLITIAEKGIPVVISSSPQGGSTAPIQEEGIVAQVNAEVLAGITLTQIVKPGTPVLYGAVPVRARMDTLHDLYGAPEFIHYNQDCAQMAHYYNVPCYSSSGVGDAKEPGLQATIEKVFSQLAVASAGPQYIHYSFGLLDKTNVFSPLQAVLDDAHVQLVRQILRQAIFTEEYTQNTVKEIRQVLDSQTKLFAKYIRKARRKGLVSNPYPFESDNGTDKVLEKAYERLQEILNGPDDKMNDILIKEIYNQIPGLLPQENFEC